MEGHKLLSRLFSGNLQAMARKMMSLNRLTWKLQSFFKAKPSILLVRTSYIGLKKLLTGKRNRSVIHSFSSGEFQQNSPLFMDKEVIQYCLLITNCSELRGNWGGDAREELLILDQPGWRSQSILSLCLNLQGFVFKFSQNNSLFDLKILGQFFKKKIIKLSSVKISASENTLLLAYYAVLLNYAEINSNNYYCRNISG